MVQLLFALGLILGVLANSIAARLAPRAIPLIEIGKPYQGFFLFTSTHWLALALCVLGLALAMHTPTQ